MGFLRPAGSWSRVLMAFSLLIGMLWVFAGCDDSVVDPDLVHVGTILADTVQVPEFWVLDSEEFRTVRLGFDLSDEVKEAVRNSDLTELHAYLVITPPPGYGEMSTLVGLADDGGVIELQHSNEWVDVTSGDLIPGDYVFALRLNTGFALGPGEYSFGFIRDGLLDTNMDHPQVLPQPFIYRTVTVSANEPPEFGESSLPDSLYAGFDVQQWVLEVTDPNEQSNDEVVEVLVELIANDISYREFLFAPLNPPTWTFAADSSFAAGLPTADYTMSITARDKFDQPSELFEHIVWIENLAPQLLSLSAPDTVQQPGPDDPPNGYTFTLDVTDSQGQGDIESVYYEVTDPTGGHATSPEFVFRDDGEDWDEVAGDGTWTHRFQVNREVSNFGTYIFSFHATDRAGQESDPIEQEIELIVSSEPQP